MDKFTYELKSTSTTPVSYHLFQVKGEEEDCFGRISRGDGTSCHGTLIIHKNK